MSEVKYADLYGNTKSLAVQQTELGNTFVDNSGREFKYVQYDDGAGNITAIAGMVALGLGSGGTSDAPLNKVTCDYGTAASDQAFAGIIIPDVVRHNEYCWIQVSGPALVDIWGDGSIQDRDYLVPDTAAATHDGAVDTMAAGEEHQSMGVATADDETDVMIELPSVAADFSVGGTVTGGSSSATGTIKKIFSAGGTQYALLLTSVSGTFSASEALTSGGGGSCATCGDFVYYRIKAGNARLRGWR